MIDRRRADLERHLEDLRKNDGWHPFQHFVIGLLHHAGYTDVRHSNPRSDLGRDAVAIAPDGKRCVVAVSFECTKAKVLHDAQRWTDDPDREDAAVLLFVTTDAPAEKTWSKWKPEVKKLGLELRMFHLETILDVATRDAVWRETCARLSIPGHRPGYRLIAPYDGELLRAALQARPAEWLAKRIELYEWAQLSGEIRNRLILGKPGAGKTTTLFVHLEATRPDKVVVVEPDLRDEKVEELLDTASGGGVIVFDDAHERPNDLRALLSAVRARQRDIPEVAARFRDVHLLLAARSQEWAEIRPAFSLTELQDLHLTRNSRITLGRLTRQQCHELVVACVSQWDLEADNRLVEQAATKAVEGDATPLYVLSILAPARVEKRLRDKHLNHLPESVLELWQMYWERLSAREQGVLRLVKLFSLTSAPYSEELFDAAAKAFSLSPHEVAYTLIELEKILWIVRDFEMPTCLDVQLEAIPFSASDLLRWDGFSENLSADPLTRVQLHIGTGDYYFLLRATESEIAGGREKALLAALRHFSISAEQAKELGPFWRAATAYKLSQVGGILARLERSREKREAWLTQTIEWVEIAISVYEQLGIRSHVAMARDRACYWYADIAALAKTQDVGNMMLEKAIQAGEEAVRIYRALGFRHSMAMSLNTVSIRYLEKAGAKEGSHADGWLDTAQRTVEEASLIVRELRSSGDLALVLTCAGNLYYRKALRSKEEKNWGPWLRKATEAADEAIRLFGEVDDQTNAALAIILAGRVSHLKASLSEDRWVRLAYLRSSLQRFVEARSLYRENALGLLGLLASIVNSYVNLARNGDLRDADAVHSTCLEGLARARDMESVELIAFFNDSLRDFREMLHQKGLEARLLQHPSHDVSENI